MALQAEGRLEVLHDRFCLLRSTVCDHPAGAFGDPKAHEEDHDAQNGPDEEGDAPTDVAPEHRWIEQHDRAGRPERSADPEAAVDDKVRPAAHPARDQLLDGRVDGRVLAADAGTSQEAEEYKAPHVPREGGGGSSQ